MNKEQKLINLFQSIRETGEGLPPPEKIGLSPAQVRIIDQIYNAEILSIKELAINLNLTPPTVSVAVRKLTALNFLEYNKTKSDGRYVHVRLSEKGYGFHDNVVKYRTSKVQKILNRLQADEQDLLLILLEKALKSD
jgi:DNA-binding MarR family transcriptional regulator